MHKQQPIHSFLSTLSPHSIPFHTDTSEPTDSRPFYTIATVITALTSGVAVFSCVLLLAASCYCVIMLRKKCKHKKESKVSECVATVSQQEDQRPQYEEIPLQGPHYEELPMQNYPHYYTVEDIA